MWLLTGLPLLLTGRLPVRWANSPNDLLRQMVMRAKTVAAWGLLAGPQTRVAMNIR